MTRQFFSCFVLSLLLVGSHLSASAKDICELSSPDGRLSVAIATTADAVSYTLSYDGEVLVSDAKAALRFDGSAMARPSVKKRTIKEHIDAPFYRVKSFDSHCNEATIRLNGRHGIIFRAYDEGMAYRFYTRTKGTLVIDDEVVLLPFTGDHTAYLSYSTNEGDPFAMAYQNIYTVDTLSQLPGKLAFLPVTVDCGKAKITVLESDQEAYPGMFLRPEGTALRAEFAGYPKNTDKYWWRQQVYVTSREDFIARVQGTREYPWRILAVTTQDTQMPTNNLVYALASPSRVGDTSWIKPGKSAWDWWNDWNLKGVPFHAGINMDTYRYFIDFAQAHGLPYIILDEGWYESKGGDMLKPIDTLDLPALVRYGQERGVGIVLWCVFNVLDEQLETICGHYSQMGIKGFKVDFLDRDDQTAVEMAYRIAEACARHKLVLDYHGFYKPTGMNRTYPNIINFEGVFGMEETKWNEDRKDMPLYDVTFPYIRMMAGPVDFTPGAMRNASKADYRAVYSNPMSMGTRCHQLAMYIVYDSPFTMLADAPTNYLDNQECLEFIASLPDEVDATRVLHGKLGEHIVTARRVGDSWYIGGMTNWDERDITLSLDFLPQGRTYQATLFRDGVNANKNGEDYAVDRLTVDSRSKLSIHMAQGGGFALRIE